MTPEEREEYNKLSKEGNHFYDLYRDMHPEWSHAQLMTMAIMCCQNPFDGTTGRGATVKEVLAECIRKADEYMEANFPGLYPAVKDFFISVGQAIKYAAQVTWDYIMKFLSKF